MKLQFILIAAFAALVFSSCNEEVPRKEKADVVQARQTEQSLSEANRQIGMPEIVNFQQRKLMKQIYEITDREDLVCYAYLQAEYSGKLVYIGRCLGYGIPFSAQFTNPEKVAHQQSYNGGSFGTLPQADPNGLFMPTSSSATWLLMLDPESNEPRPVYFEPTIVVSPFPITQGLEGDGPALKRPASVPAEAAESDVN